MSAEQLLNEGYVVIEVIPPSAIECLSKDFLQTALLSPELQPNMNHTRFVMGGVGYCPFASFAYHPLVRHIHRMVYEKSVEIFREMAKGRYFSMLPDRQLIRFPGQIVNEKGKWHQDDAANAIETDECYGGWLNLNYNVTQYFKAIPRTHHPDHPIFEKLEQKDGGRRGFANFRRKEDYDFLENYWKKEGKKLIEIPPGHALIFRETMIHTVFKNPPTKEHILRQHISFMLAESPVPLHDRATNRKYDRNPIREYFADQALIPVRSGQDTPVYSPMNRFPASRASLEELSSRYIPECRDNNNIVKKYLPSLRELERLTQKPLMHPEMTREEIGLYIPHHI